MISKGIERIVVGPVEQQLEVRWILWTARFLAITLGALHGWVSASQQAMNADGIAYLDIGDAYLRGDLSSAINPVWSPLYAIYLGISRSVLQPSMQWEFPVVHLANFTIYLFTLFCFELFWRELMIGRRAELDAGSEKHSAIPEWLMWAVGYSLFTWSALYLIELWAVTPDMLMAGFVFLAASQIVRVRRGIVTPRVFALLGTVLGLGYLTKTIMFPMAFVFLFTAIFSVGRGWRGYRVAWPALITFLVLSTPYLIAISHQKGRLTIGEVGRMTYLRYVNGYPYPHWQGEGPGRAVPEHPSRQVLESPAIYEFASPIGGTYPIGYDPSYWYDGATPIFDPEGQIRLLMTSSLFYLDLFMRHQGAFIIATVILYGMSGHSMLAVIKQVTKRQTLLLIPLAALALYGVVYVEGRYVAVFLVILWAELLAGARLSDTTLNRRLVGMIGAGLLLVQAAQIAALNLQGAVTIAGTQRINTAAVNAISPPRRPSDVAVGLHALGVRPGDKVAVIGYAFDSYWARLAQVQIVAEMFNWEATPLWLGDIPQQNRIIEAFAGTGAVAIVAEHVPAYAKMTNWHRVGDANYYIYLLQ